MVVSRVEAVGRCVGEGVSSLVAPGVGFGGGNVRGVGVVEVLGAVAWG